MKPLHSRTRTSVIGLGLALLLTLTTAWALEGAAPPADQPAQSDDPIVIQVGSTFERLSDLEWRFEVALRSLTAQQGIPFGPEVAARLRPLLPTYLDQRSQELALVVEARRRGLTPDTEQVEADLEGLRDTTESQEEYEALLASAGFRSEEQVRGMLIEADIVDQLIRELRTNAEANVTDATVRARYLAERERFTVPESICARHILVAEEALAAELMGRLAAGEAFEDLAAEHGTDATRSRGGDLGCFGRGVMVPDFEAAVLGAEVGVPSGPVQTQFGYHLVLVYERTPAGVQPFAEVEEQVREYVVSLATEAAIDGIIEGSGAITYPERLGE